MIWNISLSNQHVFSNMLGLVVKGHSSKCALKYWSKIRVYTHRVKKYTLLYNLVLDIT